MKQYWMAVVVFVWATMAVAQTSTEVELLSAQKAYQDALSTIHNSKTSLLEQQSQLVIAKQRLVAAQNSVSQLEAEVTRLQAAQTNAEQNLEGLGQRLDAAWTAVKP